MSVALEHWLTEHREHVLPRWVSTLCEPMIHNNGDGTGATIDDGSTAELPFSMLQNHEMHELLGQVYEGLLHVARGNAIDVGEYLSPILQLNGNNRIKLPDLLSISFHLRQIAWDIFQQDLSDPSATFGLMQEFDALIEHSVKHLAQRWETSTETEIQERISQAEFIAESMSITIEQADRTALQLSSLNIASQSLAESLENSEQLLELVGSTLLELVGASHISIWMPEEDFQVGLQVEQTEQNDEQQALFALRVWGQGETDIVGLRQEGSDNNDLIRRCYSTLKMIIEKPSSDIEQAPWYLSGCGVCVLPLIVQERAIGVVLMQDTDPEERFSRSQQDLARAIVNQASVALENARLYAKIRRFNEDLEKQVDIRTSELQAERDRLGTVHEISKEISSTLDLDTLLQTTLESLARITNVEYGSIMMLEADTGHLVTRAVLGHQQSSSFTRFPLGSGVAGWVAQYKKSALISDVNTDERWIPRPLNTTDVASKQTGSMVAVPLVAHNEILGVLTLSHSQHGYFNEDHLRLLTASAGAIAIGINNANMYNTIFAEMERSSELLHRQHLETSKMEAILQSLSDGVLVCDTYGEILSANPAAGRILQREIEELFMGTTLYDVLGHLLGNRLQEMPLDDLLSRPLQSNSDEPRVFESTVELGVRIISLTMGPVLKGDGELLGALLLMHDITREVEAERLKTEFIGTMSHELRTPMTAIKGFTQLLSMGGLGPVNDTQKEFLNTIQNNAERMISMINDVLDITKIETGSIDLELRPIHLAEALSGVVSENQNLINTRNHTLKMAIPGGLPLVRADSTRLHQILNNLLSNAIKYTSQGGEISIEAFEVDMEKIPDDVRNKITDDRRYVQMDVKDTGVGIASHEKDLVFERFYRTENKLKIEAGGTGLGLSLVKPLIEILGGYIWVESVLDEGSTFSFVLPAV